MWYEQHSIENVMGRNVTRVLQCKDDNFKTNVDDVAKACTDTTTVILVNPNNPTGHYIPQKDIISLFERLPPYSSLVIDETYIDYVGRCESVETLVPRYNNHRNSLTVIKSMSKFYALSGLMVAYAVATRPFAEYIRQHTPPWPVNLMGQIAAVQASKDEKYYCKQVSKTHVLRKEFKTKLEKIQHLKIYPSVTNFLFIELVDTQKTAQKVYNEFRKKNIFIRNCDSQSTQLQTKFIRIADGNKKQNNHIVNELKQLLYDTR